MDDLILAKQPLRGLIPISCVIFSSIIFILIGENIFHVDPGLLSVFALFFVWSAFVISLTNREPLKKIKQPVWGLIFLLIALTAGILHPFVMNALGYGQEFYWPIISNLFLGIGLVIAFGNPFAAKYKQPKAVCLSALFMYTFAILTTIACGMIPAIWFAFFVYMFFCLDQWPVSDSPQPIKGIMIFTIMAAMSLVLEYSFRLFDTSFFQPDGGLWFVTWIWWLVAFSWQLESWPFQKFKQPLKGFLILILTVTLTISMFYIIIHILGLNSSMASAYIWIFVSWLYSWDILFGKWPADRDLPSNN